MQLLTIKHFKSALSLGFFFKLTNIQNIAVNQNCHRITAVFLALQCLDTVGWASGRAYGPKKTDWWGVGVVISVCSEVQTVRIWSSWCHSIPKPYNLLPHLNPDWFYLSGTGLPRLSCKKRPLNGCSSSSSWHFTSIFHCLTVILLYLSCRRFCEKGVLTFAFSCTKCFACVRFLIPAVWWIP